MFDFMYLHLLNWLSLYAMAFKMSKNSIARIFLYSCIQCHFDATPFDTWKMVLMYCKRSIAISFALMLDAEGDLCFDTSFGCIVFLKMFNIFDLVHNIFFFSVYDLLFFIRRMNETVQICITDLSRNLRICKAEKHQTDDKINIQRNWTDLDVHSHC